MIYVLADMCIGHNSICDRAISSQHLGHTLTDALANVDTHPKDV